MSQRRSSSRGPGGRRESLRARRARARRILATLEQTYPEATTALSHGSALELLLATVLSAQCTDARVNMVTPELFRRFPTARLLARADTGDLERLVHSTGFFRNKAKALKEIGRALEERHGGEVPDTMEELVRLPGVGRKTASVVLGTWFGVPALPVDTHVARLSRRLGLTSHGSPDKIEQDLAALVRSAQWSFLSHGLILHGRKVCAARRPRCDRCELRGECPWPEKQ